MQLCTARAFLGWSLLSGGEPWDKDGNVAAIGDGDSGKDRKWFIRQRGPPAGVAQCLSIDL